MNNKLFAAIVLAAFATAPIAGITASDAGQAEIDQRLAFSFNPTPNEFGSWLEGTEGSWMYPYASEIWFTMDPTLLTGENRSQGISKVYGSEDRAEHAKDTWDNADEAFDPTAIPTDSITFNPAVILHTDLDYATRWITSISGIDVVVHGNEGPNGDNDRFAWIRACSQDSNLKKHLRTWYEPNHDFHGPRVQAGNYAPATVADVIQVESTYYMIDAAQMTPNLACANQSSFPFPTEGLTTDEPECVDEYGWARHNQPGLDTLRPVDLTLVEGSGTAGTIRLETTFEVRLARENLGDEFFEEEISWDCIQFFDHMVHLDRASLGGDGLREVRGTIWYLGNTEADTPRDVTFTQDLTFWDRDNKPAADPVHNGANGETRTFYTQLKSFPLSDLTSTADGVVITVGKELQQGDIFYVDGVRYEIPAIHVVDGNMASITLRTPLPKSEPCERGVPELAHAPFLSSPQLSPEFFGLRYNDYEEIEVFEPEHCLSYELDEDDGWTSVPRDLVSDRNRVVVKPGDVPGDQSLQDEDFSVVTTQWIVEYNYGEPLPLDPPFNRLHYRQVDDIDVILWECDPRDVDDGDNDEIINSNLGFDGCQFFPWGGTEFDGDSNGLPIFPEGERYLTMRDPPQEWLDYWNAELTDAGDEQETKNFLARIPATAVDPELAPAGPTVRAGIENGINPTTRGNYTWCHTAVACINTGLVNFTWVKEWVEDRFSTNNLEIPNFEGERSLDEYIVNSHPDEFTSLLLPNRTNLASTYWGQFQRHVGPLGYFPYDDDAPDRWSVHAAGGDYLHTTSWFLQDGETRHAFTVRADTPNGDVDSASYGLPQNDHRGDIQRYDIYVVPSTGYGESATDSYEDLNENQYYWLNVYGSEDRADHAKDTWDDAEEAFNPAAIPKDSVTFNPAVILHTDLDYATRYVGQNDMVEHDNEGPNEDNDRFAWIRACSQDSNLKKHLRLWYEPNHDFHGPRVQAGNYAPATVADVIQVESTYYMIDAAQYTPNLACANQSSFPFPTEGLATDEPECADEYGFDRHNQPGLDTMRPVDLTLVEGSGTAGTIRLETTFEVRLYRQEFGSDIFVSDYSWDCIQFFDHMVHLDRASLGGDGLREVRGTIWYLGNTEADTPRDVTFTQDLTFWDRDNKPAADPVHNGANGETRTFYTQLKSFPLSDSTSTADGVVITVGKELQQGDIFYVDGVRYEIPAIHVVDGNMASITLRTPLPKSEPCERLDAYDDQIEEGRRIDPLIPAQMTEVDDLNDGTYVPDFTGEFCEYFNLDEDQGWTSVPRDLVSDRNRVVLKPADYVDQGRINTYQDEDFSVVTTQWIVEYNTTEPLPLDPPFNRPFYRQADDIDVILWECDPRDVDDGDNDEIVDSSRGFDGCQFFPWGGTEFDGDSNGLPIFPEGQRYLTMRDPPQEWLDYWMPELTDAGDEEETKNFLARIPATNVDPENYATFNAAGIGTNTPTGTAGIEYGINPSGRGVYAWCGGAATCIERDHTNLYYTQEWYEHRYSTNLLQIPNFEGERSLDESIINSHPDQYTQFHLPNRTNLASQAPYTFEREVGPLMDFCLDETDDEAEFETGYDYENYPGCTINLTGGDYLVMTSLRSDGSAPRPPTTTSTTTTETETETQTSTSTSTTSSTTTTTTDDDGGSTQTPGFELVALLAALGAAFVLVRRRL